MYAYPAAPAEASSPHVTRRGHQPVPQADEEDPSQQHSRRRRSDCERRLRDAVASVAGSRRLGVEVEGNRKLFDATSREREVLARLEDDATLAVGQLDDEPERVVLLEGNRPALPGRGPSSHEDSPAGFGLRLGDLHAPRCDDNCPIDP